jgi:hypothetical protein
LIYPPELEAKETTDTASSALFLDFNFKIMNFPNMCSNILASPAYGQSSTIFSEVNVKNIFTSHIEKNKF